MVSNGELWLFFLMVRVGFLYAFTLEEWVGILCMWVSGKLACVFVECELSICINQKSECVIMNMKAIECIYVVFMEVYNL